MGGVKDRDEEREERSEGWMQKNEWENERGGARATGQLGHHMQLTTAHTHTHRQTHMAGICTIGLNFTTAADNGQLIHRRARLLLLSFTTKLNGSGEIWRHLQIRFNVALKFI